MDSNKYNRFKEFWNSQRAGKLPTISQISLTTRISQPTIRNYLMKLNMEGKAQVYIADGKIIQVHKIGDIK